PREDGRARKRRPEESAPPLLPRRRCAGERAQPRRARRRDPIDVVSHRLLAELHPTFGHPESTARLAVLLEAFPDHIPGRAATEEEMLRCHDPSLLELLRSIDAPLQLEPSTIASETSFEAARLAAGTAIE